MNYAVLDTDVASGVLRGKLPPSMRTQLTGRPLAITFVTVGELTVWTALRNWGPRKLSDLAAWRQHVVTLPYDNAIAETWGMLQARAVRRGRPRPTNDTWIAACCLVERLPLATLNTKDFEDFAEYEGLELISA